MSVGSARLFVKKVLQFILFTNNLGLYYLCIERQGVEVLKLANSTSYFLMVIFFSDLFFLVLVMH